MIWLIQLVFDCRDPDAVMQFWGQSLGYRNPMIGASAAEIAAFRRDFPQFEGRGRVDDNDLRRMPIYIQRVPEPKDGRNRVRLEVASPDPDRERERLVGLGARSDAGSGDLSDIEGNEFTIVQAADEDASLHSVVIDATDPDRLLHFWASATGYQIDRDELRCSPTVADLHWRGDHFELAGQRLLHICGAGADVGPAPFDLVPGLEFSPTDQPKHVKNRLHVDLNSTDVNADRDRLTDLGATVIRWDTDHVLADPEGNEFCLSGIPPARG